MPGANPFVPAAHISHRSASRVPKLYGFAGSVSSIMALAVVARLPESDPLPYILRYIPTVTCQLGMQLRTLTCWSIRQRGRSR
jgi:hypothetical protein